MMETNCNLNGNDVADGSIRIKESDMLANSVDFESIL